MENTIPDSPGFARYTKQNICDNTLDEAKLETRCPLDNGRHIDASIPTRYSAGKLEKLPAELLIQVLRLRGVSPAEAPRRCALSRSFVSPFSPFFLRAGFGFQHQTAPNRRHLQTHTAFSRTQAIQPSFAYRVLFRGSHSRLTLLWSTVSAPPSAMVVPKPRNTNVQLLACLVDEDDTYDSDYRFLVNKQHVKYVTTAPGTFRGAEDDRIFEPILLGKILPPFPIGNWNKGHVAKDPQTGEVTFVKTETVYLEGVKNLWHPVKLNELDFTRQERVRQRVHISTHPELNDGKPVLVKIALWPWEIPFIEVETAAYQRIKDSGIGPKFLGHLTEGKDGRVVGFVVEWIKGARTAGPGDIASCKKALGRLHELGIKFGDINKHNFLVRDGHDVVLVDFETAKHNCLPQELEDEMRALEGSLEDTSCRGGVEPMHE